MEHDILVKEQSEASPPLVVQQRSTPADGVAVLCGVQPHGSQIRKGNYRLSVTRVRWVPLCLGAAPSPARPLRTAAPVGEC